MQLWSYDEDADEAHPGENVKMKVAGVEEEVKDKQQQGKKKKICMFLIAVSLSSIHVQ